MQHILIDFYLTQREYRRYVVFSEYEDIYALNNSGELCALITISVDRLYTVEDILNGYT